MQIHSTMKCIWASIPLMHSRSKPCGIYTIPVAERVIITVVHCQLSVSNERMGN